MTEFFESFGHDVSHLDRADAPEAPQTLHTDPARASAYDVVVLSTPISATPALLEALTAARSKALIFDICSLKTPLIPALEAAAQAGLLVTSVHPMFGPGAEVLAGRNIIVCRVGDSGPAAEATAAARAFFADTTASVIEIPLRRHDELMSYVLGLSHLTNLAFAEALAGSGRTFSELRAVASTTFTAQLDVTVPVAGEHQDLYYEIQAENRHTPHVVSAMKKALDDYAATVAGGDRAAFRALMERGRSYLTGG
jgi:chorismate mutase/prephenate dehydrogenase